jgi:small multidrug resistance pump
MARCTLNQGQPSGVTKDVRTGRDVAPPPPASGEAAMQYVFLAISIVSEVIATSALKASDGFTKLAPSITVVIGYAVAFHFLALTLKTIPIGVAYAIWAGAGVSLVAVVGWVVFGQKLDAPAIIGMAMIIGGVIVLQVFSKVSGH